VGSPDRHGRSIAPGTGLVDPERVPNWRQCRKDAKTFEEAKPRRYRSLIPREGSTITAFDPQLVVRLTGPAVGPGRLAARDLAELSRLLDQALLRIGLALSKTVARRRRPSAREIEELCQLYVVSWVPGSAVAGFDLAEPRRPTEFGHLATDSLNAFLAGLSKIVATEAPDIPLPRGFDRRVLETCAGLGKLLEHGIAVVSFSGQAANQSPTRFDAWARERIHMLADRDRVRREVSEVAFFADDGHLRADVAYATKHRLMRSLPGVESSSFWRSTPIEQLAADQGVPPITDAAELGAMWSEGDVFDDALSDLLKDRAERRR